ncbi:MAG: hypothetical protein ACRDCF_02940 [Mycoplasmoidaceae bacterium]
MKNSNITKILLATLYKVSSISIVLGVMISIIVVANSPKDLIGQILPIIIFSCVAAITSCAYMIILTKEYTLIRLHMTKNWIFYDWVAIYINLANMIFSLSFITSFSTYGMWGNSSWVTIVLICIVLFISLIGVGFQQYSHFKINVDIEKRKNGENSKESKKIEEKINSEKEIENAK